MEFLSDATVVAGLLGLGLGTSVALVVLVSVVIAVVASCVDQERRGPLLDILDRLTALVAALRSGKGPEV